jgi:hypothetical protein
MFVNSPPALPSTIAIGTATFGPPVDETGVTGDVVLVDDGTGTTSDGCEPLVNGAQIAGNIALIDRGTCAFVSKAENAEAAGAIAVIIANNVAGATPITLGGTDTGIGIPVVSITLDDGNAIKAQLGTGVNVTITLDPSELAGTDSNGRVKLYTPNPYQGGSSVSHWDVSAFPSLLMEPAITDVLSDDVDLTLAHFSDIGWLDLATGIAGDETPSLRASDVALLPAYPNPFNPSTTIRYEITSAQRITLGVYDVQGRLVKTLADRAENAGAHEITWQGRDNRGQIVASGIYLVRLAGEDQVATRKIIMLK